MSLNQLMGWDGPLTHRQYNTWQAWRERQWNRPKLTDQYIIQLSTIVSAFAAGITGSKHLTFKELILEFGKRAITAPTSTTTAPTNGPPTVTKDLLVQYDMNRWFGFTGFKPKGA